ncbi:MAG: hypothetical protein H0T17_04665 [Propionibacteriales bacterium]|nr:hypothetical protein [Propionibacteriales bacterium]
MMQGVSDKLLAQFASCLETRLGGPAPVAEDVPDTAVTPASAAEIASAGPDGAEPTGTPIADQAEKAVKAKEAAATSRPRHVAAPAPSELDLGATVLPVLLKRYAVQTAVVVFLLLVLNRLRRRTR